MVATKRNPYDKKIEVKTTPAIKKPALPFGIMLLAKIMQEEFRGNKIPSVILTNSLQIAKSSSLAEKIEISATIKYFPTDIEKREISHVMEEMRKPQVQLEKLLVDFLTKNWILKAKNKPVFVKEEISYKKPFINKSNKKPVSLNQPVITKKVPIITIKKKIG